MTQNPSTKSSRCIVFRGWWNLLICLRSEPAISEDTLGALKRNIYEVGLWAAVLNGSICPYGTVRLARQIFCIRSAAPPRKSVLLARSRGTVSPNFLYSLRTTTSLVPHCVCRSYMQSVRTESTRTSGALPRKASSRPSIYLRFGFYSARGDSYAANACESLFDIRTAQPGKEAMCSRHSCG
jgi:hypothetical protein